MDQFGDGQLEHISFWNTAYVKSLKFS